jgi:hypothetical protein
MVVKDSKVQLTTIGNEHLLNDVVGLGPQNSLICNIHGHVKPEVLLIYGSYLKVCYKCVIFSGKAGMAQRVQTPGERGSRSISPSSRGSK